MSMPHFMTEILNDVGECVDKVLRRVGPRIVLALPLGIGKPNPIANEFYRRAARDPAIQLTILTALSLRKPEARSGLERRLLGPIVERVFGSYVELEYVRAQRKDSLPANVRVIEFFLSPGTLLGSSQAQRSYLSANYTDVAQLAIQHGVNVIAQLVAKRVVNGRMELSFGSNPDVTLDLLPFVEAARAAGRDIVLVGEAHSQMPFMPGTAIVPPETFDWLVDDPQYDYDLYCPPNLPIGSVDHAIGMHASALVRDGGTLQVGIGELGDALVYALLLRHQQNAVYRDALSSLGTDRSAGLISAEGGREPFGPGLFASTEMFVDQLLDLYRAGILRRLVYDNVEDQVAALDGAEPLGGQVLHAAFFLGPRGFYGALRNMHPSDLARFSMRGVSYVNQLYGPDYELKILQRRDARHVNTAMMVTLLGAAVSDALEDGRVVSGVGGQYNFVAMAHALPGARSIVCVRSTRVKEGRTSSNIVWSYGHCTIPRHLRDIVVTEYGIADLRGRTDEECIAALLQIADSRFQEQLLAQARDAGKIAPDYWIPAEFANNTPARIEQAFAAHRRNGFFSEYPFGTDLTAGEIVLARALKRLQARSWGWRGKLQTLVAAMTRGSPKAQHSALLRRLGLDAPTGLRERMQRRLVSLALGEIDAEQSPN
jgi:acyl-CoA hydrolase